MNKCIEYERDESVWCDGDCDCCQTCKLFNSVTDKCLIGGADND